MGPITSVPRECSIARTLDVVGERWSLLAIREIFFGVCRFDEIVRNTGASRDILATRLRKLVDAGVLVRVPYNERPPRYEYHLTDAGRDLKPILMTLMQWGDRYLTDGTPPMVPIHDCGAPFTPEVSCASCHKPLRPGDMRYPGVRPSAPTSAHSAHGALVQ